MIPIERYIASFSQSFDQGDQQPWSFIEGIEKHILALLPTLGDDYVIENNCAIHRSAILDANVSLKGPIVIGQNCFVGANSHLRNGVFLADAVRIGTGCEVKASMVFEGSAIAHFNFIGDSILGQGVNFEAGSITANHFNERKDKDIYVLLASEIINTGLSKFGALVGDHSKIGANAVLSPGSLLDRNSVVKRLELIEQVPLHML